MDLLKEFKDCLVYVKNNSEIANLCAIHSVYLQANKAVVIDSHGESFTVNFDDMIILKRIIEVDDAEFYENDIVKCDGELYLISRDGKEIDFYHINEHFEKKSYSFTINDEHFRYRYCDGKIKYVGNSFVLKEKQQDFNIKVVKYNDEMYYACNNKEINEVDLIKAVVVYAYGKLNDVEYKRVTLTHEQFVKLLSNNVIVEVTPNELYEYFKEKGYF